MLSRKGHNERDKELPKEWSSKVLTVLEENYNAQLQVHEKKFEVYAFSFPDEVLIAVSLLSSVNQASNAVTYLASADLDATTKADKILNALVDSCGLFYDTYFESNDDFYNSSWSEEEFQGINFYYKVTRENIGLTIQANKLLD